MQTTPRLGISYPDPDRHDRPDIPLHFKNQAVILDTATIFGQGLLADRPISSTAAHGIQGRFYMQTDISPHVLWWDNGTSWDPVGYLADGSVGSVTLADGSVTTTKLGDLAVTSQKIANGAVGTLQIADNSITAAKLVDGIVPSRGALGATEALRAIGAGAGQVLGGNDTRIPTQGQKDALSGSWGTPSASNPFVTANDPRLTVFSAFARTMVGVTNKTTYGDPNTGDLTSLGPQVTGLPDGQYYVTFGAVMNQDASGSAGHSPMYLGVAVNGTNPASDNESCWHRVGYECNVMHAMTIQVASGSGNTFKLVYRGGDNSNGHWQNRYIVALRFSD